MKLIKTASGKKTIKMSKKEWQSIGKKAGWMKTAWEDEWYDAQDRYTSTDDIIFNLTENGHSPEQEINRIKEQAKKYIDNGYLDGGAVANLNKAEAMIPELTDLWDKYGKDDNFQIKYEDLAARFASLVGPVLDSIDSWDKDEKNDRANLENTLKAYNYNIDAIEKALGKAESDVEEAAGREDWVAEFAPTPQGFQDAQDLQNERVGEASEKARNLEQALNFLTRLQGLGQTAKSKKTLKLSKAVDTEISAAIDEKIRQRKQAKAEIIAALTDKTTD